VWRSGAHEYTEPSMPTAITDCYGYIQAMKRQRVNCMESMFWADIVNQAILRVLFPFRVVKHLFSHISVLDRWYKA